MSGAGQRRPERVAERIKIELMELFVRGDLRDPSAADCFITAVSVSDDLRQARVYVRLLRPEVAETERARVMTALGRAAGFLRRQLAPRLQLRYQPELRFFWDAGVEQAARVEELLAEIERDGTRE